MPVESYITGGHGAEPAERKTVQPGTNCVVAADYHSGNCEEIMVCVDKHDKGADVYKINREVRRANHGGMTEAMERQCYIGSVATNGVLGPLYITSEIGQIRLLHIEHKTERYTQDQDGRFVQNVV